MQARRASVPAEPQRREIAHYSEAEQSLQDFGGIASDEIILPRCKLMNGQSPEVQNPEQFPHAKNGEFFHTVSGTSLGKAVKIIPIWKKKTFELWGDRDSNQGLLATADADGVWDKPHHKFQIPVKNSRVVLNVDTKANVEASGLLRFGTSDPSNPKSKPLLAETFRLVVYLPEMPQLSPVMCIYSRMAALRTKELLTRMQMRIGMGEPIPEQVFEMRSNLDTYGPNKYFAPHFSNLPRHHDADLAARIASLARSMQSAVRVRASDEGDEHDGETAPRARVNRNYKRDDDRDY